LSISKNSRLQCSQQKASAPHGCALDRATVPSDRARKRPHDYGRRNRGLPSSHLYGFLYRANAFRERFCEGWEFRKIASSFSQKLTRTSENNLYVI
jgi:hypothetical protein